MDSLGDLTDPAAGSCTYYSAAEILTAGTDNVDEYIGALKCLNKFVDVIESMALEIQEMRRGRLQAKGLATQNVFRPRRCTRAMG